MAVRNLKCTEYECILTLPSLVARRAMLNPVPATPYMAVNKAVKVLSEPTPTPHHHSKTDVEGSPNGMRASHGTGIVAGGISW